VKTRFAGGRVDYSGRELRSHWIMEKLGLEGDAIVSFRGACMVRGEDLVDREDFALGNIVAGDDMLHFIVEIFGLGLLGVTLAQRLLCSIATETVNSMSKGPRAERRGDDLYVGRGKLSVSVATVSPVSGLIHLGLNVTTEGVPVEAECLTNLGIDPAVFAGQVLSRYAEEIDSAIRATYKVRPVT
jgi:hypothetical protein